jgi:hypothetical protein
MPREGPYGPGSSEHESSGRHDLKDDGEHPRGKEKIGNVGTGDKLENFLPEAHGHLDRRPGRRIEVHRPAASRDLPSPKAEEEGFHI